MNRVKITEDIINNDKIKKELVIAHVSDIHYSSTITDKDMHKLYQAVYDMKPDYLMITGDILDSSQISRSYDKVKDLVSMLTELAKITKILISIGNHDVLTKKDYDFFKKLDELPNIYVLDGKSYTDENVFVAGFTLPMEYYYNLNRIENEEILVNTLDDKPDLLKNLPHNKLKIALIHSPINLTTDSVFKRIENYDLILSGHTHNGMVPNWLSFLFKKNGGLIAPNKRLFPEIARGRIDKQKTTIIICGGYTKLSKKAGKVLNSLNFLYNKSINKIIIRKRGIKYEN